MATKALFKTTITRQLGRNTLGNIYLAKITTPEGQTKGVILQTVMRVAGSDRKLLSEYAAQAQSLRNLSHENIARVYDVYEEDDHVITVSDYVDGRTVSQVIAQAAKQQTRLGVAQALYIGARVADALDHAHRCTDQITGRPVQIVHGDLTSENVIIGLDGKVYVTHFGMPAPPAKTPEKSHLRAVADGRDDILALGVLLWEMLAGKKISSPRISIRELNPEVDKDLEQLLLRMLAPAREARYQSASDAMADLNHYLSKINPRFSPQMLADDVTKMFMGEFGKGANENPFANVKVDGGASPKVRSQVPVIDETSSMKKRTERPTAVPLWSRIPLRPAIAATMGLALAVYVYKSSSDEVTSRVTLVQTFVKKAVDKFNFDTPSPQQGELANVQEVARVKAEAEAQRQMASIEAQINGTAEAAATPAPAQEEEPYKPSKIVTYENKIFKIDSVPQGAAVYVDGKYIARTPTQFIVPEKHHVRVDLTLAGYADHEEDLVPHQYNHEMKIVLEKRAPASNKR